MRIAALGLLLTAMVASTSQAGFVTGFGFDRTITQAPFSGWVDHAVWKGDGGTINGQASAPTVAVGEYAYLYQPRGSASNSPERAPIEKLTITGNLGATGAVNFFQYAGREGTVDPSSFGFAGNTVTFDFQNPELGGQSKMLYFISTYEPTMGFVNITASGGSPSHNVAAAVPAVPVPVPPALALVLAGAPFAEFIRRRRRSS